MDFELTEDQTLLQGMIREFAQDEIAPAARDLEDKAEFPSLLYKKLAQLGLTGMSVPAEYGGIKTDLLSLMIVIEEISHYLPSLAVVLSVHSSLFCYSILQFGTEDQKSRYLPKAASGDILGAFSLTEPGAGSDATNIQTKALKSQGDFVLQGTKNWVSNGANAQAFILFAATSGGEETRNISAFIIDRDTPGLTISKIEEKMGLHSSPTAEISLDDCRVPADNLLGQEGQGHKIAFRALDGSRIGIAAQSVGLSQRALDEAVNYARHRMAFGKPIAELQAIQFMIADMAAWTEAARLMTYRAASLYDRDKLNPKDAAMAKLYASEAANRTAYNALQIHGGYGYSHDFPVEQIYRDARVLTLYEGTSEIQRLVIARQLLQDR